MGGNRDRHPIRTSPAGAAPVSPGDSTDPVVLLHGEIERDLGALVAPLDAHSPAPMTLAAAWAMFRAAVIEPGLVDRTTKEAAATALSLANSSWYCAELHLAALESRNESRARASADSDLAALADHRVRQVTEWARTTGMRSGIGPRRPFGDHHVPELVGTMVVCHYLNRMANVFLPTMSEQTLTGARPLLDRVAAAADRTPAPGTALDLLSDAALPPDLAWAEGSGHIAVAFARAAAAIEEAGARSVPESVRAVVSARIATWQGETPDPGHDWLAALVTALPTEDRPAARLALLTALAPHEVDEAVIELSGQDRRTNVELMSWASFAAARRVGTWLAEGAPVSEAPSKVLPFRRRGARTNLPPSTEDDTEVTQLPS
jgi:AhpD family alkylhydroperoxidase